MSADDDRHPAPKEATQGLTSAKLPTPQERLRAIGEISAGIAHELRNVLQIISASAYLAQKNPGQAEAHLAKIERNARHAQGIVDDLMALARGEPARAELVPIAELAAMAREELEPGAARFEDDVGQLRVRAHPRLLCRLLHVLYENAIQASRPAVPRIVTRGRTAGDRVILRVSDDGPGIPEEIRGSLFDALVSRRPGGTGLGLALARRIADAHGATLRLARGEDTGATFEITFGGQDGA
jgi:signal transduction histidine kinase